MRNTLFHLVFVFLFLCSFVNAAYFGVDVSTLTSTAAFSCLKSQSPNPYVHVGVRAWKSSGIADTNCPQTVANAWAAGVSNVDVYFFPCYGCAASVATQVQNAVNYLASNNVVYSTFWLDVEGGWSNPTNLATNQAFFQQMRDAAVNAGVRVGIYTSKYQWTAMLGSTYTGGSAFPLWYPRYDNISGMSDFVAFGGWTAPVMKQYQQTTPICGASVDFNYAPGPLAPFSNYSYETNVASARAGAKVSKCDINNDGNMDLVATGVSYLYAFMGSASGTFPSTPSYTVLVNATPGATTDGLALDCVDINQDGYADVLVGDWTKTPAYVRIYSGSASGLVTSPTSFVYNTGSGHYYGSAIVDADFDHDGNQDIAVGAYGLGRVFIHWGLGSTGLNPTRDAPSVLYPNLFTYGQNLATCDFSNDGFPELIVGCRAQNSNTGTVYIYGNTGGRTWQTAITRVGAATGSYFGYDAGCGDVNGDGNKDLVVLSYGDKLLYVYYGTGSLSGLPTTASVILPLVDGARSVSVADQNLDGISDLVVGHHATNKIQVWYGGSNLSSSSPPSISYQGPTGNSGWNVATIGNADGKGTAEIAFGSYTYAGGQTNEGLISVLYF